MVSCGYNEKQVHFAESQSRPDPTSHGEPDLELRGALHDVRDEPFDGRDLLVRGLEDELVVHLQGGAWRRNLRRERSLSRRTIAILMMSAAEPWNGAFSAMRSALPRTVPIGRARCRGSAARGRRCVVTSRVGAPLRGCRPGSRAPSGTARSRTRCSSLPPTVGTPRSLPSVNAAMP